MITNMANLALVDKAATPVTHQFTPAPTANGLARWNDKEHNGGIAIGYSQVSYRIKEPVNGNGLFRHTIDFVFPKVDSTVPARPGLVGISRAKVEFTFPDVLNDQERKDIVNLVYTALSQGSAATLGDNIAAQAQPY